MSRLTIERPLVPVGFQTISLSNSTAVAVNSTIQADANVLDISVETNDVRYRADGTDPTLNTGVLIPTGNGPYRLWGYNGTSDLKFQRSTGSSSVSIMGYEQLGARD